MKLKQLVLVFASLLAISANIAFATDHEGEHKSGHEMKTDTDGDGKMSYEEYRASKEKKSERQFKKMDTNGDGYIDAAEKQALKDKMRAMRDKRKQKAQTN